MSKLKEMENLNKAEAKRRTFYTNKINVLILAIICTLLWGSAYPSIKIGYELFNISSTDISDVILFAGYRFAIAGLMTIILASIIQKQLVMPNKDNMKGIIILGFIQTCIQYVFFYIGLSNTTGVKGSILNATGVFISVILAHFYYKNDRLNIDKIIGCAIGFAGIVIVNLSNFSNQGKSSLTGEGFILLAAASFAVGSLISKKVVGKSDSMTVTGYQLLFGGAMLTLVGIITGGQLKEVTMKGILLLIYMAAISAVAFTLWTSLLEHNKVGKISIFNFLVPVFGSIMSAIFLKETIINIQYIVALLSVCIGIYIVNREKKIEN